MLNIEVDYVKSRVLGDLEDKTVRLIRKKLSYNVTNVDHINRYLQKSKSRFVMPEQKFLFHKKHHTFPTGLVFLVKKILDKLEIPYKVTEKRVDLVLNEPLPLLIKTLRDYQIEIEDKVLEKKNCVVRAATGAGKTLVMTSLIGKLNGYQRAIFVRRTMLLYQTKEEIEEELGIEVGIIGNGIVDIKDVTMVMIPTAARALDPKFKFKKEEEDDEDDKKKYSQEQKDEIRAYLEKLDMSIFDECFVGGTRILTEDGWRRIESLVKNKYSGRVLSYNESRDKIEFRKVVDWFRRSTDEELIKIGLHKSDKRHCVTCTLNHKFYLKDGKIKRADEIKLGDIVMMKDIDNGSKRNSRSSLSLSENQLQVARGTTLGDGYLNRQNNVVHLQWMHGWKQKEYIEWKLGVFGCRKNIYTCLYGWAKKEQWSGWTKSYWQLKEMREKIYINGKKTITPEFLLELNELGLAVWFMDDGTYNKKSQYFSLATNGFSYKEQEVIQKYFKVKWDVNTSILYDKRSNSYYLNFPKESSKKIRKIISPYMIPSMRYKGYDSSIPIKDVDFKFLDYGLVEVGKIERNPSTNDWARTKNGKMRVYNLTVEGNHNYIANGFLVSNCHCTPTQSVQLISKSLKKTRYLGGFSATPFREDGTDILIHAATGPKVINISASYLIDRNYLVQPDITFYKSPKPKKSIFQQKFMKWHDIYKEFIVENEERNNMIVEKAIDLYNNFEKVVILVKHISHGEELLRKIEETGAYAEWISGKDSMSVRKKVLKVFSKRSRAIVLGSEILSEGVNVPAITALINAGGGKSASKYYQQLGRAIRVDPDNSDKTKAIIVDFLDEGVKYLAGHAKSRVKLIKTEPKYILNFADN